MKSSWAEPDVRDEVVDYIRYWSDKTGIKATKMIRWIGIHRSKYYDWASRYGKVNKHNAWIPRDFWLADYERQAIIDYYHDHPLEGYHRTIKSTCIRVQTPLSLQNARNIVADFVDHYNTKRLHSAICYITPKGKLDGRAQTILADRDAKLAAAREARKAKRIAS